MTEECKWDFGELLRIAKQYNMPLALAGIITKAIQDDVNLDMIKSLHSAIVESGPLFKDGI